MLAKLFDLIRSMPEVSNLRLLLSEARQECAVLRAENAALKAENQRLQGVVETQGNEIQDLKRAPDNGPDHRARRMNYQPY